jgi:RNA polymerase subunit RPABC4/transcription elongation factor Spt4
MLYCKCCGAFLDGDYWEQCPECGSIDLCRVNIGALMMEIIDVSSRDDDEDEEGE